MKKLFLFFAALFTAASMWGADVTATLTGSALTTMASSSTSYTDYLTGDGLTDTDGNVWFGRWCYQKSGSNFIQALQFKAPESSYGCRLVVPTFQGNIKTITIVSTANTETSASSTTKATGNFVLTKAHTSKTYSTEANKIAEADQTSGTSVIDLTELSTNYTGEGLYIVSTANARIWSVTVVYEETAKVDVTGVTLDKSTANVLVSKTTTLAATITPANATVKTVTWESDDEEIATVVGGIVTGVSAGTATITAKSKDDPTLYASCVVTVSEPAATGLVYKKVTTDLTNWAGKYLIVYESSTTKGLAMDASLASIDAVGNAGEVKITDEVIAGNEIVDEFVFEISEIEGGYAIKKADDAYIGIGGTSNGLSQDASKTKYKNVISYNTTNSRTDIIITNLKSGTPTNMYLKYNSSSGQTRFRYYASDTNKPIQLYRLEHDVEITSAGYATLYLPFDATIPENVTAYTAAYADNTLTLNPIEGGKIKANTGVVLKGAPTTYTFTATTGADDMTSALTGVLTETTVTNNQIGGKYVYTLAKENDVVGFYLYNGTILAANKAYLPLETALSDEKPMTIVFTDEVTGVEDVRPATGIMYDIMGRQIANPVAGQLYIMDGVKYIAK